MRIVAGTFQKVYLYLQNLTAKSLFYVLFIFLGLSQDFTLNKTHLIT